MPKNLEGKPETYTNPVYPQSFPDPFVLKFRGEYFAYCTGDASDGNLFGILHSKDLVNWAYIGSRDGTACIAAAVLLGTRSHLR